MTREKPLLIYDGDCSFCRRRINRWKLFTGDRVDYAPYQEAARQFPEISPDRFKSAVQLVEPNEKVSSGAEAVFRTLTYSKGRSWMLWMYENIPFVRPVSDGWYKFVADHRPAFSFLTKMIWGNDLTPATFSFSSWLFRRALGVIYLIAFASLAVQIIGLIGKDGILPAQVFLDAVSQKIGLAKYWLLPTLFWFNAGDFFIQSACWAGVILSLFLIVGFLETPILFALWFLYLSIVTIAGEFLSFQWDILLLEVGFLAVFLAPLKSSSLLARPTQPSAAIHWLFRLLLFRLLFFSGVVKLASGDPAWRNLTALTYHYQTQPLPTWIGWYFHHFPLWFQKFSATVMFGVELIVPFLIFMPKRLRLAGAVIIAGFQLLIFATGNYCFFNLLTIALCLLLIDDAMWKKTVPSELKPSLNWPKRVIAPIVGIILLINTIEFSGLFRFNVRWPWPVVKLYQIIEPLHLVNSYGLFAVMTKRRPEIIVEGSRDGQVWYPYEFKYKPGDPKQRPGFVEPHQPRLDWQMWFAALGSYKANSWFINFCIRLLQGSPEVLQLIAKNPFPDQPPRFIRAMVYEYRFASPSDLKARGDWWRRELVGPYCPTMSLDKNY